MYNAITENCLHFSKCTKKALDEKGDTTGTYCALQTFSSSDITVTFKARTF